MFNTLQKHKTQGIQRDAQTQNQEHTIDKYTLYYTGNCIKDTEIQDNGKDVEM